MNCYNPNHHKENWTNSRYNNIKIWKLRVGKSLNLRNYFFKKEKSTNVLLHLSTFHLRFLEIMLFVCGAAAGQAMYYLVGLQASHLI